MLRNSNHGVLHVRKDDQCLMQVALNAQPTAVRIPETAVGISVIEGRIRLVRNVALRNIDIRLNMMGISENLDLLPYMKDLDCRERWRIVTELHKGLPSGTIEHWSWMPGGGRAGVAAHCVWKVLLVCPYAFLCIILFVCQN